MSKKENKTNYSKLENIEFPADLKQLNVTELEEVCAELRQFIIENAAENGGHFGSSLGVVELTVALHYVFNTPNDRIVWDVGHQAYGHKILTGRRKNFYTNRKKNGISGFPKQSESEYDAFVAGHASISISAALGMATASKLKKENRKHIAVIGDGAMTGGIAFEGINNAGDSEADLLVILNDNQMSIDPNVGALKNCMLRLTGSKNFNSFRRSLKDILQKKGKIGKFVDRGAAKIEQKVKNFLINNNNFFETLNFRYFGPYDGNDVENLVKELKVIQRYKGPKILHILTTKGKGFIPAEKDQTKWHSTSGFNEKEEQKKLEKIEKKEPNKISNSILKYQEIFGKTLVELAEQDEKIVGITPAMPTGSSLNLMLEKFPKRAFDVGICEPHAVTFASGLASEGLIPFCNIYSTFAQRAFDQIIHDVCIEKTPVIFCLDRAGLVGEDGETHQGSFDIAYLRMIPNLIVSSPMNEIELRNLMYTAYKNRTTPFSIRYPRGKGVIKDWQKPFKKLKIGKAQKVSDGKKIAILTFGTVGNFVIEAKQILTKKNINPAHYNMRFVKPLDEATLHEIFQKFEKIITVEDGSKIGGLGSAVLEFSAQNNYKNEIKILGIPDEFIKQGTVEEQKSQCGFDVKGIVEAVKAVN